MKKGEAAGVAFVLKVRIEPDEFVRTGQGLVDDRSRRQGRKRDFAHEVFTTLLCAEGLFRVIEPRMKARLGPATRGPFDEQMQDDRQSRPGAAPEDRRVDGYDALIGNLEIEAFEHTSQQGEHPVSPIRGTGEKDRADRELPGLDPKKLEWDVGHDPRAVAGSTVGLKAPAMFHGAKGSEGARYDPSVRSRVNSGDETDATRGMLLALHVIDLTQRVRSRPAKITPARLRVVFSGEDTVVSSGDAYSLPV